MAELVSGNCCVAGRQVTCREELPAAGLSEAYLSDNRGATQLQACCSNLGLPLPLVYLSACLLQGGQALRQLEAALPHRVAGWRQDVAICPRRCSAGVPASCRAVSPGLLQALLHCQQGQQGQRSRPQAGWLAAGCRKLSKALLSRCTCLLQSCQAPSWLTTATPLRMVLLAPLPLLATKQSLLGCRQQRLDPQWMLQYSQGRPPLLLLPQVNA